MFATRVVYASLRLAVIYGDDLSFLTLKTPSKCSSPLENVSRRIGAAKGLVLEDY